MTQPPPSTPDAPAAPGHRDDAGAAAATWASEFYERYWGFRVARGDTDSPKRIKLRHEQAVSFIENHLPASDSPSVLDLGCGDGVLGQMLTPRGYRVTGADVSSRALGVARRHYETTRRLDLDHDPTPEDMRGAFDAVACLEVLEHLETPRDNLRRALDCCRPGGYAVMSYPNLFSWKNRLAFLRGRWPENYTTYDPREHLQVFELGRFQRWLTDAGFCLKGLAITPDLPRRRPMRKLMFRARGPLARIAPTLSAMQINVFAQRPPR